MLAGN